MDLGLGETAAAMRERVAAMIRDEILPAEEEFLSLIPVEGRFNLTDRQREILDGLKERARRTGLWNLWRTGPDGSGLTTVEYAWIAEETGRSWLAAEVFNCSAPDTGNMEVLLRYGSPAQQERWLEPLLGGSIRSAYLMTEPDRACSDATGISMRCARDQDALVLDGEKWWATGAGDPRCAVYLVLVRTGGPGDEPHRRHSLVLVPAGTVGVEIVRPMTVFGHDGAPHGHMHLRFRDVRVPAENLVLGEGRGFEVAQGRLGPGRIHHCMRAIGTAEDALERLCRRSLSREAFGRPLAELGANHDVIATCRIKIEMARLLCLRTAHAMDHEDGRQAAVRIHAAKAAIPEMVLSVLDEAIQMHGAAGVSQDTPLALAWTMMRTLRLADGPDAVHRRQVARAELARYRSR